MHEWETDFCLIFFTYFVFHKECDDVFSNNIRPHRNCIFLKSGFKNAILQENAVSVWPDVVGKNISNISKATNVDKGVLFIKVESATWKQELYMQKNEIINKINKKIGSKAIKEIRLVWMKTKAVIVRKALKY